VTGSSRGPAARVGRILVVEDSPSAQRLLQQILLRLGAQLPNLRVASTVVEALTVFTQWRPDLVFIDIELRSATSSTTAVDGPAPLDDDPRDGIELARRIRSRNPSVTLVISSATDPSDPRVAALREEGRIEFLTKPLIAARVEALLSGLGVASPRRSS
jgi:CheY-like chemotaxis protein